MTLYRQCEKLAHDGYLAKLSDFKTTKYEATSLDVLHTKVEELSENVSRLEKDYFEASEMIENIHKVNKSEVKVIHYDGAEEVKQLLWNSLSPNDGKVYSFGYRTLREAVGRNFVEKWWTESVRRNIINFILTNPKSSEIKNSYKTLDDKAFKQFGTSKSNVWRERVLPGKVFKIRYETFIYNNVFAVVQWKKGDIFGVEIYNQEVADQEKEIFKVLWGMALSN